MKSKFFDVLYEDNHIIVVNKASGMLVQGDKTGDITLPDMLKSYIKEKYDKPGEVFLGVVHRLDRPVTGAVVFARTSKALERMNEMFRKRQVQKTYWALVRKKPPRNQDTLVHWLVKNERTNTVKTYHDQVEDSQKAELSYKTLGYLNEHYLLEVEPITGRSHQIRAQLAAIGCPIRGDLKYGAERPNPDGSINLHARRLYFLHPVQKKPLVFLAPLPPNQFWEQFLTLEEPSKIKDKNLDFLY